jgi:hypothetical protein
MGSTASRCSRASWCMHRYSYSPVLEGLEIGVTLRAGQA